MLLFWPTDWWALASDPDAMNAVGWMRGGFVLWSLVAIALLWRVPLGAYTPLFAGVLLGGLSVVSLWSLGPHLARLDQPWFYAAYVVPFVTTALFLPLAQRIGLHTVFYAVWMLGVAWHSPDGGLLRPHWNVVLLYGAFVMLTSVVVGQFVYSATLRSWATQDELDRLAASLQSRVDTQTAELRELARFLTDQRETDLAHLSRELHDEFGQVLTGMRFDVDLLGMKPENAEAAQRMSAHLDRMLTALRSALDDLRPQVLEQAGLTPALDWLVSSIDGQDGMSVELQRPDTVELPDATALAVFRIAQEALTNAARHSGAERVSVVVEVGDEALVVRVVDDGAGLPTSVREGARGIVGMRERALAVGGTLSVMSEFGGTTVTATIPRGTA